MSWQAPVGGPESLAVSRVVVAVNPTSGGGRGSAAQAAAMSVLQQAAATGTGTPWQVVAHCADSAAQLRARLTEELAAPGCALVVVGGDGMVHLGVNLVAGTGIPLGIVAAGTGNDNARELGLPVGDAAAAAHAVRDALLAGRTRRVDVVQWTTADGAGGWFAGVLGAGFDAIVNERANGWRRLRGRIRYDLAIVRELPVFTPREYALELDGELQHTRAVLVAVGNGPAYGGGLRICHGAVMDDGLLDVVVAGPVSRLGLARLYPKVWSGTHLEHPAVVHHRVRTVRLASPGIVGYADGERLGPLPLECSVVPGALRLLTGGASAPGEVTPDPR